MTSPHDRSLPPLTDLPPPRRLPPEDTSLVPPGEIIAESRRAITARLLRIFWAPALILIALWYTLLILYVMGGSPTFWGLGLVASLADPAFLRTVMFQLGFTSSGLWAAFLLLPVVATVLSVALLPLATAAIAPMTPRTHLSEQGFQREVATRVTAVVMIPPILTVAALPVTVLLGIPQPWSGLGAGSLMVLAIGVGALQIGWVSIRATVSAPRVLGIEAAATLESAARLDRDLDARRAAARTVLAQDRRHLPPNPGTPQATGALTPRGVGTALARILRAALVWVVPALVGLAWVIFGITDMIVAVTGIGDLQLNPGPSPLRWQALVIGVPVLGLALVAIAVSPALAVALSKGMRDQVTDQRSYPSWAHRARVNPWEERAVHLTGWLNAGIVLGANVVLAVGLLLVGAANGLGWVWLTLNALVIAPLLGLGAASAMRSGLRDVLYGPAGRYMRRDTRSALVAPDVGTRTDRAKDPAVRAELRRRLQEREGDHSLEIFDLDAAGERLWVDDSLPGVRDTQIRGADIERGQLPDFGADDSPFTAPAGEDPSRGRHEIPDSVTGLRDR